MTSQPHTPPVFSLQKGYSGRETLAIMSSAYWLGCEFRAEKAPTPGYIPVGSVEYGESLFGDHRKSFYPIFLRDYFCRDIYLYPGTLTAPRKLFIKDARKWKSEYKSKLVPEGKQVPNGLWWVSEPVNFLQEWRYYVADGEIITTGWYAGLDEYDLAPKLNIEWPKGFSGAVDFGRLPTGEIALVECHAPFACGWYGDDHRDFALWQAIAWEKRDWWLTS